MEVKGEVADTGLIRAIGVRGLSANVVNNVVGSGIFVLPAVIAATLFHWSLRVRARFFSEWLSVADTRRLISLAPKPAFASSGRPRCFPPTCGE